jgi:hypothetical protein
MRKFTVGPLVLVVLLAVLLPVAVSAAPANPPQVYNYCLGFVRPAQCLTLPARVGKAVDRHVFRITRHEVQ